MIHKDTIILGDCTGVMEQMPEQSVDMVLTSPPYGTIRTYGGQSFQFQPVLDGIYRVLDDGGICVWVVADQVQDHTESGQSFRQALYAQKIGFNIFDTMIYNKQYRGAVGSNHSYRQQFEFMFVFSKGKPKTTNLIRDHRTTPDARRTKKHRDAAGNHKYVKHPRVLSSYAPRGNVWYYTTGQHQTVKNKDAFAHPAVFPDKLAEDHITSWSNRGDTILDPMCGSGTTCRAARRLGRHYIGIEIHEPYHALATSITDNIMAPNGMERYLTCQKIMEACEG